MMLFAETAGVDVQVDSLIAGFYVQFQSLSLWPEREADGGYGWL